MAKAWALRPLGGTPSASSTAAGFDAANVLNDYSGVVWKSNTVGGSEWLQVDLGSDQEVDAALFFGVGGMTTAQLLQVQGASNSAFTVGVWSPGSALQFLAGSDFPTHGRGVGYWEAPAGVTPPARRYWRFTVSGIPAGTALSVARLAIGKRLQLERNFAFGAAFGVRDLGRVDFSPQGALSRRRAIRQRTLGITFPAVNKDEAEQKVQPLIELAAGQEPIALVTDPEAHAQRQRRCWIGFLTGEMGVIWSAAHRWEWRVNMVDLIPIPKQGA